MLEALLDKYADDGIEPIEDTQILNVDPLHQFGTPVEIVTQLRRAGAATSPPCTNLNSALYSA